MKTYTAFAATALLAAPICLVAQAKTLEECSDEAIEILNGLSTLIENVTPQNVDETIDELSKLVPKMQALKAYENKFSKEEREEYLQKPENAMKIQTSLSRIMKAIMTLEQKKEEGTDEEKAAFLKFEQKCQEIFMVQ